MDSFSVLLILLLLSVAQLLLASPASASPSSKWPWYTTVPAASEEQSQTQTQTAAPISEKHHWFPPWSGEGVKKCWEAVHKEKETCVHDVVRSFWTHKVVLDGTCCAAIAKVSDDCFKPFGNPFFAIVLRLHCANHHIGAPTP